MDNRFLLAENPMAGNDTLAIVHTLNPISIILVYHERVTADHPFSHFTYTGPDGVKEDITFVLYHCFSTSFDGEANAVMTDKLMRKAWHWYMSYLKWQDAQIDQ